MKKLFIKTNFLLFFFFIFSIFSACTVGTNGTDGSNGTNGKNARVVILYELNGGTLPENAPLIYTYATPLELVEPVNDPYNFEGFYYNADFSGQKVTELDDSYAYGQVLYAKWSYSITFHFNDGQEPRVQVISDINSKYTFETLEKSGYEFEGWFTDENFSSKVTEWNVDTKKGNITVYAKWKEIVTITYIISSETGPFDFTEVRKIKKGDKAENIIFDDYYNSGTLYTFLGWSESISGELFDFETSVTSDLTLYAQWIALDMNAMATDPNYIYDSELGAFIPRY